MAKLSDRLFGLVRVFFKDTDHGQSLIKNQSVKSFHLWYAGSTVPSSVWEHHLKKSTE